jgi:hypothetical protein
MQIAKRNGFLAIVGGLLLARGIILLLSHNFIMGTVLLLPGLIAF